MNHINFGGTYVAHNVSITEHENSIECTVPVSENPGMGNIEELTNNFRMIDTAGIIVVDDIDNIVSEYYGYTHVDTLKIEDDTLTMVFSKVDDIRECISDIYRRLYHLASNSSEANNINAYNLLMRAEDLTKIMIAERIR